MSAVLRLLTWNIWMMPEWTFQSPSNQARAAAIAAVLRIIDHDIVCLEKAFDGGARDVLAGALADRYPFLYGPVNSGSLLKLNGGVWVLSKLPLSARHDIEFRDNEGIEHFSAKGAMLLTGDVGQHRFRLIATHLQGDDGPDLVPSKQAIRDRQVTQIRDELIAPHVPAGTPLFVCGDFCTPRFDDQSRPNETTYYRHIIETLGVLNGDDERVTLDVSTARNKLAEADTGRTAEMDYVFVRPGDADLDVQWNRMRLQRAGWDAAGTADLSYRYAVSARVQFA